MWERWRNCFLFLPLQGTPLSEVVLPPVPLSRCAEDWGTTPAVIDTALTFADENDIAITIHTDRGF